ncbi:efflux RND transporter permease subunit [Magnetofaba australis]|uniref:Putative acriflavin resistance protein D n=1 Tax=Magnetofaba australis IT-1 TaxID=1434232 RepID=A0A1Y2KAH4_9PROT|nr:efflux RND transporter permease subunit [Magnetofaba australis]OSM06924.1 putative acriflavin resistance protein D [Magnetofaba australis IT-1]
MNLVNAAAHRPVAVTVGVLLVLMFGLLALSNIPIQLTPDVRKPQLTVTTQWPGAAPGEVESELTIPQEEALKALSGLENMESTSSYGRARLALTFRVGTDMDAALVQVSNELQRVKNYPTEAERPTLRTADSEDRPITWMLLQRADPDDLSSVDGYLELVEEHIQPLFERIPGVATVNVYGGRDTELRITVDPAQLAARKLTLNDLVSVLRRESADISAGKVDEGKRSYTVRTLGRIDTPEKARAVVVASGDGGPVTLGDLADVDWALQDPSVHVRGMGRSAMAINCVREQGANVLEVMADVHKMVERLNTGVLAKNNLRIEVKYDETDYIYDALALVRQNLFIGGALAMAVLLLFLRSASATVIIALAIPISLIGAFLIMAAAGRTINVISLAGLAFAVGMVVDPAIVTLENIVRLRQAGLARFEAAVKGVSEVWGAIFIATATTVAVFLPVAWLDIQAAQLFGDIAVALCAAVLFSLVVSTTVIPTLAVRLGRQVSIETDDSPQRRPMADAIANLVARINRNTGARLAVIIGFIGAPTWLTLVNVPPAEYLPSGNRNLIFGLLVPPPGYNIDEMTRLAQKVEEHMRPYWFAKPETGLPSMKHFFFGSRGDRVFMGGAAEDPARVKELLPVIKKPIQELPGLFGVVKQSSLFERGSGRGRSIELDVSGRDLETSMAVAAGLFGAVKQAIPDVQARPVPGLSLGSPELHLIPNRLRAAENSLSAQDVGQAVDAYADGVQVDQFVRNGRSVDLTLRGDPLLAQRTQDLGNLPIATPRGDIIPVGAVTDVVLDSGPTSIRRVERERTVSLRISPPDELAMESAINIVREQVMQPAIDKGLPDGVTLRLSEGADQLALAKEAMSGQFLLALAITFLLMAALFESFLYPFVIIITVPLAAFGGLLGLKTLNLFVQQPLDVLTMLGFVALVGIVVNNAILIVHQSLNFIHHEGMKHQQAVVESVRIRVRPIFLSTFTSVFGLLPLVAFPGAGSELYRGMGSVILGGLLLATLFTLILVPALFSLVMGLRDRLLGAHPAADEA